MRRLSMQIYLTVVGIVVLFGLLSALTWWVWRPEERAQPFLDNVAGIVAMLLPAPGSPPAEVEAALAKLTAGLQVDAAVHAADGSRIAGVGRSLPMPEPGPGGSRIVHPRRQHAPPYAALALPDGRWLLARHVPDREHHWRGALVLLLFAAALAVGAYPLVRRITRRLERLRGRVDALGAGELSARVEVEGRDEVADLARSFNAAASRIERLVGAQRTALANASHELRSPLARIRVATELLGQDPRPELRERIEADIQELDELIAELLLASQLDAAPRIERTDDVDLLALLAEEAARVGAAASGVALRVRADRRMLRRAVRNLLENAQRYGEGSPIEVGIVRSGTNALLRVCDGGPGVPEAERERIFEPFYRRSGTRETGEGVGLGLSLVRQIAEGHGGRARYRTREGGGSCFEIEIPLD